MKNDDTIVEAIQYFSVVTIGMKLLMPFALRGRMPERSEWQPVVAILEDKGLAVRVEEWIEGVLGDAVSIG